MVASRRLRSAFAGLVAAIAGVALASGIATAHVRYVVDGGDAVDAIAFLVDVLSNPLHLALLAGGGLAVVGAAVGYLRFRPLTADVQAFRRAIAEYTDLLPWMVRLSLGLPLIGAGYQGYLFTPLLETSPPTTVRLFGLIAGFLLLFGLATRLVAAVTLVVYVVVLPFYPVLLLAFEYVPGLVAVVLLGGGRPSADQIIARIAADDSTWYSNVDPIYREAVVPFQERIRLYRRYVPTVVRLGLGFAFIYLGFSEKLAHPGPALAVVEKYSLTAVVPVDPGMWVVGAGLSEIAVGLALMLGVFTRASGLVAFGLFTTTLFALPDDPVLAHVSLFGLTSMLLVTGGGPFSLDRGLTEDVADFEVQWPDLTVE